MGDQKRKIMPVRSIEYVFTITKISINDLRRIHSVRYPKEVVLKEGKKAVIRPLEKQNISVKNLYL